MAIVPAMQCASLGGWYPLEIQSASDPDVHYAVHVNPWANRHEQHMCECKSYQYRGRCRHQIAAHDLHCGWNEVEGPEEATELEKKNRECPRCGGPTMWAMWEVEDEDK
jgi:ribosomal protein S27AE